MLPEHGDCESIEYAHGRAKIAKLGEHLTKAL